MLCAALGFLLPGEEHLRVTLGDVVRMIDSELRGSRINPFRRTFDLRDITNWGLVQHYVAASVAPFGAKFLILEGWQQPDGDKDRSQRLAIFNLGLSLYPRLMFTGITFGFVRNCPDL